jgi:hypothetical protein
MRRPAQCRYGRDTSTTGDEDDDFGDFDAATGNPAKTEEAGDERNQQQR